MDAPDESDIPANEITDSIPVLHARGTHYQVGFQIGETFRVMIQELLGSWPYYNNLLTIASTSAGKALVENTLNLCTMKFPQYINEIKGMAAGSQIEFEKLFILNMDSILCTLEKNVITQEDSEIEKVGTTGCTSILCRKDETIFGHTEDAMTELDGHVYIISAEIISDLDYSTVLENFTTFCYAGTLMGFTMGFNSHGMLYSVNTTFPTVYTKGTPRAFISRALLAAPNLPELVKILKDTGNGIADGFSLNIYFYPTDRHGSNANTPFYNIEIAPPKRDNNGNESNESVVDVHEVDENSVLIHCNRFMRIESGECNQTAIMFSDKRSSALKSNYEDPATESDVKKMLSDQSDWNFPVYNDGNDGNSDFEMSFVRTVATGIFNINERTWSVYSAASATSSPVHKFVVF